MKINILPQRHRDTAVLNELQDLAAQIRGEVDAVLAARRPEPDDGFKISPVHQQRRHIPPKFYPRIRKSRVEPAMRKGEVRMKDFVNSEITRRGTCSAVIYGNIRNGQYPRVTVRYLNTRVAFVTVRSLECTQEAVPQAGEMALKEFVAVTAQRCGASLQAIYTRIARGRISGLVARRANNYLVFVSGPPVEALRAK